MNVGLYFGSFNPIHIGHLIIANQMVENSDLDEIWFVVTPHNPFKEKKSLLANHHRLEMVHIALEDYPKLKASDIEFKLPQPNYTIHTLSYISEKYPNKNFHLIMGEDNLKSLHKWKNYKEIIANHTIYVYPRIASGIAIPEVLSSANISKVEAPIIEISSTLIRKSIPLQKNIKPLLPYNVWKYLDEMNFYR